IYEVWRTAHGAIFAWDEHFDRLERSAEALGLHLPWTRAQILPEVLRTVAVYREATSYRDDVYIRMQVSRGAGAIGLDVALADKADFVLLVQPCPGVARETLARGMKLSIATALRRNPIESLSPAWKTGNYLNNILCLREARARGADEVVITNLAGEITEAAVSNIAFVTSGRIVSPPLTAGILEGVTRPLVATAVASEAGMTRADRG